MPTPSPWWNCYGMGHAFREGELCQGSVMRVICFCLLCPYLVCFLSLFHVIMSSFVSRCVNVIVLITLCILVLSFEFDFIWSTRYFPVYPVSLSCLVRLIDCLDVLIKYYYLSLYPRLRVPVPPSCVHRDNCMDGHLLKLKCKYSNILR